MSLHQIRLEDIQHLHEHCYKDGLLHCIPQQMAFRSDSTFLVLCNNDPALEETFFRGSELFLSRIGLDATQRIAGLQGTGRWLTSFSGLNARRL